MDLSSEKEKTVIKNLLKNYLLELGILEETYITSRYVMREFKKEEVEILVSHPFTQRRPGGFSNLSRDPLLRLCVTYYPYTCLTHTHNIHTQSVTLQ